MDSVSVNVSPRVLGEDGSGRAVNVKTKHHKLEQDATTAIFSQLTHDQGRVAVILRNMGPGTLHTNEIKDASDVAHAYKEGGMFIIADPLQLTVKAIGGEAYFVSEIWNGTESLDVEFDWVTHDTTDVCVVIKPADDELYWITIRVFPDQPHEVTATAVGYPLAKLGGTALCAVKPGQTVEVYVRESIIISGNPGTVKGTIRIQRA